MHRMVAEAFIGPCPKGWQINHINADTAHNHASNLEYMTLVENVKEAWRRRKGEQT